MQINQYPNITTLNDSDLLLIQTLSDGAYKNIKASDLKAYVGVSSSSSGGSGSLLLDGLSNIASARSVARRLLTAYSGNALQAIVTSGGSTANIGFTSGNLLDVTALETFAGSNNVYANELYDQVGSFNATQATFASCPQIITSGSIPVLHCSNDYLSCSVPVAAYPLTIVAVVSIAAPTNGAFIKCGDSSSGIGIGAGSSTFDSSGTDFIGLDEAIAWIPTTTSLSTSQLSIVEINCSGSAAELLLNGVSITSVGNSFNAPSGTYNIGGYSNRLPVCNIHEDVVFNAVINSTTRSAIVANMKAFYGIS